MGSDCSSLRICTRIPFVSIHAPAWGATCHDLCPYHLTFVSIHAPAWGATIGEKYNNNNTLFQSTLPHGERLSATACLPTSCLVSIHAPAWGATKLRIENNLTYQVSIHAPAWGATLIIISTGKGSARFNPRSRMGSDSGVTVGSSTVTSFNPRSRMGSDLCILNSCG